LIFPDKIVDISTVQFYTILGEITGRQVPVAKVRLEGKIAQIF